MDVRPYAPGDEVAILDLFERSFGKRLSAAFWRWRFLDDPHGPPRIELAWDGDVLAGHYAVSPTTLAIEGERCAASLSMTTMTHPDYRGQGLFGQLATRLYERLSAAGDRAVFGFPNAQSHRGFIRDLGWRDVHEIPMLRLDLASTKPLDAGDTRVVKTLDASVDALWERCRRLRPIIGWRDAQHLTWRYLAHPTNDYTIVQAATGYAVSKRIGEDLDIVDLLVEDEDASTMRALLGGVLAASPGARAVHLWLPLASPLHLELERIGFVPGAPVTYLGVRTFGPTSVDLADARAWYYTMGDSDVF
jgi:GNAT superfamily N-acetyltransferase